MLPRAVAVVLALAVLVEVLYGADDAHGPASGGFQALDHWTRSHRAVFGCRLLTAFAKRRTSSLGRERLAKVILANPVCRVSCVYGRGM